MKEKTGKLVNQTEPRCSWFDVKQVRFSTGFYFVKSVWNQSRFSFNILNIESNQFKNNIPYFILYAK